MTTQADERPSEGLAETKAKVELYLGYLKIELSIMALLSTFCIAALSLILKVTAGAEKDTTLAHIWSQSSVFLNSGTLLLLFGALSFYRQRSLLAEYYGELCFAVAMSKRNRLPRAKLNEVEAYKAWRWYRAGFACTVSAMLVDFLAIVHPMIGFASTNGRQFWCSIVCTALVFVGFAAFERWLGQQFAEDAKEVDQSS